MQLFINTGVNNKKRFLEKLKMARNLVLWGKAYSIDGTPVELELDVNGVAICSADIVTTTGTMPAQPTTEEVLLEFDLGDEFKVKSDLQIRVKPKGGDVSIVGLGDKDWNVYFGNDPGQLKSNVSYNGGEPYDVTDEDLAAFGGGDGVTPGEFHLTVSDSSIVTFDYALPDFVQWEEPAPEEEAPVDPPA